jgi:hypothetical protein
MKKIQFRSQNILVDYLKPNSASRNIPDWFKTIQGVSKENHDLTIKKCMPVLDAFTLGYTFRTSADVMYDNSLKRFIDNGVERVITHHADFQLEGFEFDPSVEPHPYKWINQFHCKTPKGYSTLFTHPLNRGDLPFTSMSAVVDTDKHPLVVQFPFFIKKDFNGLIPAGTPILQAIPFKRDDWKSDYGDEEESYDYEHFWKWFNPPMARYKREFWQKKTYD